MRWRVFGLITLAMVLTSSAVIARVTTKPARQWAITWLSKPTLVGSTIVQGPVMFVHDEDAMKRGEPCTRVYLFEPGRGPADEVTAFHCHPIRRNVARAFTVTTRANAEIGYGCVLTEYQFAGDDIGHSAPLWDISR